MRGISQTSLRIEDVRWILSPQTFFRPDPKFRRPEQAVINRSIRAIADGNHLDVRDKPQVAWSMQKRVWIESLSSIQSAEPQASLPAKWIRSQSMIVSHAVIVARLPVCMLVMSEILRYVDVVIE